MKKLFFFAAAALAMLSAASCQKDPAASVEGGNAVVSLSIALPEAPQTRAIAQAVNADIVYFEVWNSDWTTKLPVQDKDGNPFNSAEVEGRKANIELTLVADQTYNFLFWAQNKDCGAYSWDQSDDGLGLKKVNIDYSKMAEDGNNDIYDAFYKKYQLKVNGAINETVVLYRPFAQLNFATERMTTSFGSVDLKASSVTVTGLSTAFDLYNECGVEEDPASPVSVTFVPKDALVKISESLNTNNKDYTWITMDYMLMQGISDLVEVEASFDLGMDVPVEHKIASVPLKKNYRTNIIGDVFAADAKLQIIIDQAFLKQDEDIKVGVPEIIFPDANGVYNVEKAAHILWLSQESTAAVLNGKTISFAADIDMMGQGFLPINLSDVTILGNGHKVFNYKVKGDSWRVGAEGDSEAAGLFGAVKGSITDLHVEDVLVEGNWSAGALVGYIYGSVKNCSATNVEINSIPYASIVDGTFIYDDANNVGGLIGYVGEGSYEITGNTVEGATITGYRCLGGLAGTVQYGVKVDNNTVANSEIFVDMAYVPYVDAPKTVYAGKVIGRPITTDITNNTDDNVTVNYLPVVETVEELKAALVDPNNVAVYLLPGTYDLDLVYHNTVSGLVIKSLFHNEKAVITGKLVANKDIKFEDVDFAPSANSTKNLNKSTYGSYVNGTYAAIITLNKVSGTFENCTFDNLHKDFAACAINYHGEATDKKLVVNNCTFNGVTKAIYSKVLCEVTNSTFNLEGGVPLYVWPRANGNGECTFTGNNAETDALCKVGLLSQTAPYKNVVFNVQNNTGTYTYSYAWTNAAKCATDGSVTFAAGSDTFNIDSDGKMY